MPKFNDEQLSGLYTHVKDFRTRIEHISTLIGMIEESYENLPTKARLGKTKLVRKVLRQRKEALVTFTQFCDFPEEAAATVMKDDEISLYGVLFKIDFALKNLHASCTGEWMEIAKHVEDEKINKQSIWKTIGEWVLLPFAILYAIPMTAFNMVKRITVSVFNKADNIVERMLK